MKRNSETYVDCECKSSTMQKQNIKFRSSETMFLLKIEQEKNKDRQDENAGV